MKKIRILIIAIGIADMFIIAFSYACVIIGVFAIQLLQKGFLIKEIINSADIKSGFVYIEIACAITVLINLLRFADAILALKREAKTFKDYSGLNKLKQDHIIRCINEAAGKCLALVFALFYVKYIFVPGNALVVYGVPSFALVMKFILSYIEGSIELKKWEQEAGTNGPSF